MNDDYYYEQHKNAKTRAMLTTETPKVETRKARRNSYIFVSFSTAKAELFAEQCAQTLLLEKCTILWQFDSQ